MTHRPRWIIWTAATVVFCAAWVALVYLPLRQQEQRDSAERADWQVKVEDMLQRLNAVPAAVARLDSLERAVALGAGVLPAGDSLDAFLSQWAALGLSRGVATIRVEPELASMMALNLPTNRSSFELDTLLVNLSASGSFHSIGGWLDEIEAQPAFRFWRTGRWDDAEEPGNVRFSGMAAILVAVPKGRAS